MLPGILPAQKKEATEYRYHYQCWGGHKFKSSNNIKTVGNSETGH